jgi:hypothetical protein
MRALCWPGRRTTRRPVISGRAGRRGKELFPDVRERLREVEAASETAGIEVLTAAIVLIRDDAWAELPT